MSDTPRTDLLDGLYLYSDDQACALAMADHARTLERELAAEQAKVARLREALERMVSLDDGDQPGLWAFADVFDDARAALKDTDG